MDARKECTKELKELIEVYKYHSPEIMDEDNDYIRKIKWIISNKLDTVDRTIFLLYTECQSLRKLGQMLNCSHSTIRPEVNRIKSLIITELKKLKDRDDI